MLKKRKVLEACIKTYEEKIENLKQSLERTKRGAMDAISSRKSWSDTTKFQESNLALALEKCLIQSQNALSLLKALPLTDFSTISVGCFFIIRDIITNETANYLLIHEGGGDSFDVDGEKIMSISAGVPLTTVLMGKKKGDKATFKDRILEIIEIQ